MRKMLIGAISLALLLMGASGSVLAKDAEKIYKSKCKMCHAFDKKKVGPSFKAMNSDEKVLREMITNGRKMMPKFGKKFTEEEINSLVALIKSKQESTE